MSLKVLILGVNGFIGNRLAEKIMHDTNWSVYGMDLSTERLPDLPKDRFHFEEGDIAICQEWVHYHVKKCDVILPLVAVATPATYVNDPLRVFELDFEANLPIIRWCVQYQKRLVFPSTSEVYGMSSEEEFNEETSALVLGPINKQRWIYSCVKQLLDRIIYAYGLKKNLNYTLFRPFNWIGPKQDDVFNPKAGSSRVVSQFIGNILRGEPIYLVDGGQQRRCFTDLDDGIDGLLRIIANQNDVARQQIFNLGNPANNFSIRELAEMLIAQIKTYPAYQAIAESVALVDTASENYYGKGGYQDVAARVPSIANAKQFLNWQPTTPMADILKKILDYYLH